MRINWQKNWTRQGADGRNNVIGRRELSWVAVVCFSFLVFCVLKRERRDSIHERKGTSSKKTSCLLYIWQWPTLTGKRDWNTVDETLTNAVEPGAERILVTVHIWFCSEIENRKVKHERILNSIPWGLLPIHPTLNATETCNPTVFISIQLQKIIKYFLARLNDGFTWTREVRVARARWPRDNFLAALKLHRSL